MTEFVMVPRGDLVEIEKRLRIGGWPTLARTARELLAASPQPVVGDREAVAQIIRDEMVPKGDHWKPDVYVAADAILASLASRPEGLGSNRKGDLPTWDADGAVWHRADSHGQVLLYTLRQDGWRKGQPVMVNDLEVRVQAGNGASIDLEAIVDAVLSGLQRLTPPPDASQPGMEGLQARNAPILPPPSGEGG